MKKLQIIAWIIFIIGIIFRLLHYPGTAVISLLGTLLLVIHSIIYLVKNANTNLPSTFLYLSYSFLTVYVLFRLQYWSCGPMILGYSLLFIIVLLLTISSFILLLTSKIKIKLPQIFLVVYFIFFFVLSFTHSYRIYYFFNLNPVLNGESRNTNYHSWDKYSWFLYLADRQDEAIEANQNAQKAAEDYLRSIPDEETVQYLTVIKQHGQKIQDKNWTLWP